MNVSFLSSTGSFQGIEYNLTKVSEGKAELMFTQNFKGLEHIPFPTMRNFIDYMKLWAGRNTRVKKNQLHVAISCRGREKTKEELLQVSRVWLERMGYGKVPAIYVFHSDTENNHIHVVANRIDENGKKINDSNEIRKARRILNGIVGVSIDKKVLEDLQEAKEYEVHNLNEFKLVLESKGYQVVGKEENLYLKKEGKILMAIKANEVEIAKKKVAVDERVKQIKALLYKYKENNTVEDLQKLLKRFFKIEIFLFGKKESPYGYSVVDHESKKVYKGSVFMPLKDLLNQRPAIDHKEIVQSLINNLLDKHDIRLADIYHELRKRGYFIKKGELYSWGKIVAQIDEEIRERVSYRGRLEKASAFNYDSEKSKDYLCRMLKVLAEDLPEKEYEEGEHKASEIISMAREAEDFGQWLEQNKFRYKFEEDGVFVVDEENKAIFYSDYSEMDRSIQKDIDNGLTHIEEAINDILESLGVDSRETGGSSMDNKPKRKRRR